jgi:polysaccharide pyruvyl transferase WcaK-like protein
MRLHGCVFAAAMGTPFFAVPYDPKVSEFMRRISMEDRILPMDRLSLNYADEILKSLQANGTAFSAVGFAAQRQLSEKNFTVVPEVLQGGVVYSFKDKTSALGWICKLMMKGMATQLSRPFNFLVRKMTK